MILSRIFRFALASSLGRAWRLKSRKWLFTAIALTLVRLVDARTQRRNQKAVDKSQA